MAIFPTSAIPSAAAAGVTPSEHFNTVLYAGNSSSQSITGVGFQPDFLWIKARNSAQNHQIHNAISGASKGLNSNNSNAEYTDTSAVTSFDSDGWSMNNSYGSHNSSSYNYVAWNWKAGGADVLNENGTIDSQVSANADAGFSIVSYTGTGVANDTIGHGLTVAPELIIVKARSQVADWPVYCVEFTGSVLKLDQTAAKATGSQFPTGPTSSVFYVGANAWGTNNTGITYISYAFHSVEGYSKVGSYTGNGSTDGTFVYCGFRPAYVMMKRTDSTGDWYVWDSVRNEYNLVTRNLVPNKSNAEFVGTSNYTLDFTSNGFKHRGSGGDVNASGGSYIYLAFAENPFKYTNAR